MSDGAATGLAAPAAPRRQIRFRAAPKIDPAAAARQGRAASLAWAAFLDTERVKSFLNSHHPVLGSRPIDLAVESADGLARVELVIATVNA